MNSKRFSWRVFFEGILRSSIEMRNPSKGFLPDSTQIISKEMHIRNMSVNEQTATSSPCLWWGTLGLMIPEICSRSSSQFEELRGFLRKWLTFQEVRLISDEFHETLRTLKNSKEIKSVLKSLDTYWLIFWNNCPWMFVELQEITAKFYRILQKSHTCLQH